MTVSEKITDHPGLKPETLALLCHALPTELITSQTRKSGQCFYL